MTLICFRGTHCARYTFDSFVDNGSFSLQKLHMQYKTMTFVT